MTSCDHHCASMHVSHDIMCALWQCHSRKCVQLLQRRSRELEEVKKEGKSQLKQVQMQNKQLEKTSKLKDVILQLYQYMSYLTVADLKRQLEEQKTGEEGGHFSSQHQQRFQLQAEFDKKVRNTCIVVLVGTVVTVVWV